MPILPSVSGVQGNIYQILSGDSGPKCAPPWDIYPWPLGKGGWTQNVCASTGAWTSSILRAGLIKSLSSNSKGFLVQLPEHFFFQLVGVFFV